MNSLTVVLNSILRKTFTSSVRRWLVVQWILNHQRITENTEIAREDFELRS